MFWGLVLEPGQIYEQKAESSFHLTMAALEPSTKTPTPNKSTICSVILESNKTKFILCNLDPQRALQQPLDCVFTEGEPISFSVNGDSRVHLTGYIMPDSDIEDSEDMFDMSESDSEAEMMNLAEKKRKLGAESKDGNKKVKFGDEPTAVVAKADKKQEKGKQQPAKGAKNDVQAKGNQKAKPVNLGVDEDDEDEDDDDDSLNSEAMKDLLDNFESEDEDDEDDEDEDEESSPEVKKPVKPQGKQNQKPATPGKQGGLPGKQDGQKNQTPQGGKKPFQQGSGGGGKPWSGGKGGAKGGPNNFKNNQNSGKKGTPQGGKKFGGNSPGGKKPWAQKK